MRWHHLEKQGRGNEFAAKGTWRNLIGFTSTRLDHLEGFQPGRNAKHEIDLYLAKDILQFTNLSKLLFPG
jgi:hypothetical protein